MKKKNKTPLALRVVSWLFPKIEKVAPWLAKRWFARLFFTPIRYKTPQAEVEIIGQSEVLEIKFEGKRIQVYQWGEGKPVLFVHGWMGRAGQFRRFVPVFTGAGYQVVSFDATGHGQSEGRSSHLMEFAGIIELLQQNYQPFETIIGHSLGGAAAMHAIYHGVPASKLIMISSPSLAHKIVDEFLRRLNASERCGAYLYAYVLKKYGRPFETYASTHIARKLSGLDLLLIHDEDDTDVDMENPQAILAVYPSARLITTRGLGHTRILKNDKVIQACLDFVKRQSASH